MAAGQAGACLLPNRTRQNNTSLDATCCDVKACAGAGDGTRIRDIQLGKLALYQLSYSRVSVRHGRPARTTINIHSRHRPMQAGAAGNR